MKTYFSLNNNHSFKQVSERTDELGFTHTNYQQLYKGVPVDVSLIMLHLKNEKANTINGQVAAIETLTTTASIDENKEPHNL